MRNKRDNIVPLPGVSKKEWKKSKALTTIGAVLDHYADVLQYQDVVVGLADGNVRIKQKEEGQNYNILCHFNDVKIDATIDDFLYHEE
ncbi:hypothetical protein [Alkalicoccus luteus]|uniref:Uncharacterized protein n=1 Tax=Alkalicoccus luteus TaxID=1237094 RepID=A0A969TY97_9BACI|nr:hypothetical protein [Alkalicoccus luteus]NJP38979.1 hypothetical protein [Alkalicoccus luteus]